MVSIASPSIQFFFSCPQQHVVNLLLGVRQIQDALGQAKLAKRGSALLDHNQVRGSRPLQTQACWWWLLCVKTFHFDPLILSPLHPPSCLRKSQSKQGVCVVRVRG
jgi:hypothetical protein